MKKFFGGLVFMALIACNPSEESVSTANIVIEGIPAGATTEPYGNAEGLVKVTINNNAGGIQEQGDYLNNMREGIWTEYHPNGFVSKVTSYVDGKKQGLSMELDNRGQVLSRASNYNDQLHGAYVRYNRSKIKEEKNYKDGQLDGLVNIYYDNGKLIETSPYKDGKRHGKSTWYDQEGNITLEYEYEEGELVKK